MELATKTFEFSILDVALYKKASQSSTYSTATANKAVDGNKNSIYSGGSCTHTANTNQPIWWEVDFGKIYNITGVEITNRGDCCGNRLKNFEITVAESL